MNPVLARCLQQRRNKLYESIGNDLALIRNVSEQVKPNSDTDMVYEPLPSFVYITNCSEQAGIALFDGAEKKFYLFLEPDTPERSLWMGPKMPEEEEKALYLPDQLLSINDFQQFIEKFNKTRTCHVMNDIYQVQKVDLPFNLKEDFAYILDELRMIKDEAEIELMRKSCQINGEAFQYMMKNVLPGMKEYTAAALHRFSFQMAGAKINSFNSIVANGVNGNILHNTKSDHTLEDGCTVLVDAGCIYQYYCSDMTRVFPINGKFTEKQAKWYNIVLAAQKKGIELCKPGVSWVDVHQGACMVLLEGLREIGFIKTEYSIEEEFEQGCQVVFQPHGFGHLLGLDTHDTFMGAFNAQFPRSTDPRFKYLRTTRILKPGMILTAEPGLYFVKGMIEDAKKGPLAKYFNFDVIAQWEAENVTGVRIEDDILITENGCEILGYCPKEVQEIEALRAEALAKRK